MRCKGLQKPSRKSPPLIEAIFFREIRGHIIDLKMPPRRELEREEKDEKNRKAKEKRSNENPEAKEVRLAAEKENAKIAREEKRRRLNTEEVQAAKI